MKKCEHKNFGAQVNVHRIVENESSALVIGYTADITVKCVDCDTPFHFRGVETGVSPKVPKCSVDGLELRAPIAPGKVKLFPQKMRYETFGSEIVESDSNN